MKVIIILLVFLLMSNTYCQDSMNEKDVAYRPPTMAGSFYPDKEAELSSMIDNCLELDQKMLIDDEIIGIIAPHAGYVFSGSVAGTVYREIQSRQFDAIIIIGPSHQASFKGANIFDGDAYVTPLGEAMLDKNLIKTLLETSHKLGFESTVKLGRKGHDWVTDKGEHSIEVQIPFLQKVKPGVGIVPICMGSQDFETADALMRVIVKSIQKYDKKVLLVASTDLSHFHSVEKANMLDGQVVDAILNYDYNMLASELFSRRLEACGGGPVVTVMMVAEQLGGNKAIKTKYATSADSPYGKSSQNRCVGYFAGALVKSDDAQPLLPELTENDRKSLLEAAMHGVLNAVYHRNEPFVVDQKSSGFNVKYPTFVTLTKKGMLRGCMGHIYSKSNLLDEISETSRLASLNDPRFGPIKEDEIPEIEYEVTVLSRFKRILDPNEIEVGKHGLYIRHGFNSGLLLPQVASERKWSKEEFLKNICRKARLSDKAYFEKEAQLYVFEAIVIH